ncbi:MAG: SMI1/KNR4 family protein [Limimaricola sp.]|uniref:hypothetical protein n=1 Tax=Limimaricola sp. TaxID=2211665 RepID=UPI001D97272A|nr:hypothetical protein [Limimaricola sp.]MBI1418461.1 SMI1/KNR4 family protein [Limimaricola sp.]
MTDDDLIAALKTRRNVMSAPDGRAADPRPLLNDAQEAASRAALGFAPPPLLMRIYREVANGGFGPGYGLMGLEGGWGAYRGMNAVQTYLWLREEDDGEDLQPGEALAPPEIGPGLLPICHMGCGIYTLVDCNSPDARLATFDPANDDAPVQPLPTATLFEWLALWVEETAR